MQFMTSACIETFPSKNPPRGLTTNSSIDGCSRCSRSRSIRSSGALYSKGPSKTIRQRHQFQQHQEQRKRPHLKHPSRMASQPPVQLLLFMQIDRKKPLRQPHRIVGPPASASVPTSCPTGAQQGAFSPPHRIVGYFQPFIIVGVPSSDACVPISALKNSRAGIYQCSNEVILRTYYIYSRKWLANRACSARLVAPRYIHKKRWYRRIAFQIDIECSAQSLQTPCQIRPLLDPLTTSNI